VRETPDLSHCDRIQIEDLVVRTIIGIYDRERDRCQDVVVNITLWTDITAAARSDANIPRTSIPGSLANICGSKILTCLKD